MNRKLGKLCQPHLFHLLLWGLRFDIECAVTGSQSESTLVFHNPGINAASGAF